MNASIRTLIYAGVALVFAAMAFATHRGMQPAEPAGFDQVGQPFYPEFTRPEKAARLRVAAYDDLKERAQTFTVEKHGDTWRIPSHHDYPAEAKKRLAETAASVIGVTREAVAGRQEAEHERYGVIDPLDEESSAIRGRGQRITLFDEAGQELLDLIVGKPVEGESEKFYVRIPGEKETYLATLDVKLSTKFSDWIEPDLLKLSSTDLVALESKRPIIEDEVVQTPFGPRTRSRLTGEEQIRLTRKDSGDDWKLADLNEATEELITEPVSEAVRALDDLKILGVRPRPPGINADFTLEFPEEVKNNPQMLERARAQRYDELAEKGFHLPLGRDGKPVQDKEGNPILITVNGALSAATNKGVVYRLHFGDRFSGSLEDIEFGAASQGKKTEDKPSGGKDGAESVESTDSSSEGADKADDSKEPDAAAEDADEEQEAEGVQRGRYVLVRAEFDPATIGEEPLAPVEPEKPASAEENKKPAGDAADATEGGEKSNGTEKADDQQTGEEKPGEAKTEEGQDGKKPDEKDNSAKQEKSPEQAAYEVALKEYESQKSRYESDKRDYDKKVEEGKKQVEQLNARFQNWYYVISNESFETLSLTRDELVKQKEVTPPEPVEAPNPPE